MALFFPHLKDFEGGFDDLFIACAFFLFFLSGDKLLHTNSTFQAGDQSTVAQRAETTLAERSMTSCV